MKLYILHISRVRRQNSRTFIFSTFSQAKKWILNQKLKIFKCNPNFNTKVSSLFLPPNFPKSIPLYLDHMSLFVLKIWSAKFHCFKIRSEPFLGVFHLPTNWLISLHFRVPLAPRGTPTGHFLARKLGLCHWNYKLPAFCRMAQIQLFGQFWTLQS